jgi:hypothetical protein
VWSSPYGEILWPLTRVTIGAGDLYRKGAAALAAAASSVLSSCSIASCTLLQGGLPYNERGDPAFAFFIRSSSLKLSEWLVSVANSPQPLYHLLARRNRTSHFHIAGYKYTLFLDHAAPKLFSLPLSASFCGCKPPTSPRGLIFLFVAANDDSHL